MFENKDNFIVAAALVSFLLSVGLWFNGQRNEGMFVGLWVPSIFAFGAFAKVASARVGVR